METHEAYLRSKKNILDNQVIEWNDWWESVGGVVPDKEDHEAWTTYVLDRNNLKTSINRMAKSHKQNWRLCNHKIGESIVKFIDHPLIGAEVPARVKRIAQSLNKTREEFDSLVDIKTLPRKDKTLLKGLNNTFLGLLMNSVGTVQSMKSIDKDIKKELIGILSYGIDEEDDDEVA